MRVTRVYIFDCFVVIIIGLGRALTSVNVIADMTNVKKVRVYE